MRILTFVLGTLASASFMHLGSAAAKEHEIYPWCSVSNADAKFTGLQQCHQSKPRAQVAPANARTHRTHTDRPLGPRDELTPCVYVNFGLKVCAEK